MNRALATLSGLPALAALMCLCPGPHSAEAGVIHIIDVSVSGASASDQVFAVTSLGITTPILATITNGSPPLGQPRGTATASVGPLGDLGVSLQAFGAFDPAANPSPVTAKVLIASDEFVNLSGSPATVSAGAIVEGGLARIVAENMEITYTLTLAVRNRSFEPLETNELSTEFLARNTLAVLPDGYTRAGGTFRRDGSGSLSWSPLPPEVVLGPFSDLGATLDPPAGLDIPLSFQAFDLSRDHFGHPVIIGPAERVMVAYELALIISPTAAGMAEAVFAEYSDPLHLAGNPAFTVQFHPVSDAVPEPSGLALLGAGAFLFMGFRWRGQRRPPTH